MQIDSLSKFFDTADLSVEHPLSPEGFLFTYHPSENPPGLHYHNFLEVGYCESGAGIFIVDGEVIPFNGRCVSIIYEGQVHIAKSINAEKSLWHFLYIDLDKLFFHTDPALLKPLKYSNYTNYSFPSIIHYEEDRTLYHLVKEILNESSACRENFLLAVQGLVYAALTIHGRYMKESPFHPDVDRRNTLFFELGEVLTYISRRYTEELTIDELCGVARMSKSTLQRKMLACVGYAPLQYVQHLRMNHAAVLLGDRELSVAEVATRSGYNTISSFNRIFANAYGVSPNQWRKEKQNAAPAGDRARKVRGSASGPP